MTVYVDDTRVRAQVGKLNARWSHLTADTDDELHAFADRIGLSRAWFQQDPACPWFNHYDVTESKRREAIAAGAQPVTWREAARQAIAKMEAAADGPLPDDRDGDPSADRPR